VRTGACSSPPALGTPVCDELVELREVPHEGDVVGYRVWLAPVELPGLVVWLVFEVSRAVRSVLD
jgi:hypothetical protein